MDYKEYSRLRSIARKRIERAAAKGQTKYVQIPTVKEVKASSNPQKYYDALKNFVEKVPTLRESKGNKIPQFEVKSTKKRKPLTEEQRKKKNFQNRLSKAKRAIEDSATDEQNRIHRGLYWKGVNNLLKRWKEAGVEDDTVNWVYGMSPKTAKSFMDYVDYRLSQGDYKTVYTVDTFVQDFAAMLQKGYNITDIQNDFDRFLMKQKELAKRKEDTNEYGLTAKEANKYWLKYVGRE